MKIPNCKTMILDVEKWPSWPFLPLKRKDNSLANKNLGFLLATKEHDDAVKGTGTFCVYHLYMFDDLPLGKEEWDAVSRTEYNTADDLLRDGWAVD